MFYPWRSGNIVRTTRGHGSHFPPDNRGTTRGVCLALTDGPSSTRSKTWWRHSPFAISLKTRGRERESDVQPSRPKETTNFSQNRTCGHMWQRTAVCVKKQVTRTTTWVTRQELYRGQGRGDQCGDDDVLNTQSMRLSRVYLCCLKFTLTSARRSIEYKLATFSGVGTLSVSSSLWRRRSGR